MKILIDVEAWQNNENIDAVSPFPRDGDPMAYRFMLPDRSDTATCAVADGGTHIEIFPDRSSAHRALKDALGL